MIDQQEKIKRILIDIERTLRGASTLFDKLKKELVAETDNGGKKVE